MTDPIIKRASDRATQLAAALDAYIEAADKAINILNGPMPTTEPHAQHHRQQIDLALNAYDEARRNLVGEAVTEEDE